MNLRAPTFVFVLLFSGCSQPPAPVATVLAQTPEQKANAASSLSALTGQDTVLQLAIPVQVSRTGVRVMGEGKLIRAPRPQPGAGPQLVVTLEGGTANDAFRRQYELPDPRLSEIEGEGQRVLPQAETFVYVELTDPASRISVRPKLDGAAKAEGRAFGTAAISTIQLSPIAGKLCAGTYQSSPLCRAGIIK